MGSTLSGIAVTNVDNFPSTPDTFFLHAYLEESPTWDSPSLTPARSVGPLPVVNSPMSVSFAPLTLPQDGRDLFLAVELTTTATDSDGGWTKLTTSGSDFPGPRLIRFTHPDWHFWVRTPTGWAGDHAVYQLWIEPLFDPRDAIGGACVAKTNQVRQPGRSNDQTIAGFLSGMHPDPFGLRTSTRNDSFGFSAESSAIQNGDIVIFMMSSSFGPGIQVPGTIGRFELDPAAMFVVGAKVASQVTPSMHGATLLLA
ncbi:MAG TPA: hypothetical protein PKE00_08340, partial [Planctomycetota bacterium]|nr:hypothetical protein [Planctomycetota bacterium]